MRRLGHPSLFRRLALVFVIASGMFVGTFVTVAVLNMDFAYGPGLRAAADFADSLERGPGGALTTNAAKWDGDARLWAAAKDTDGAVVSVGAPPAEAMVLLRSAPFQISEPSALHFSLTGPDGLQARARFDRYPSSAGPVLVVAGGPPAGSVGWASLSELAGASALLAGGPLLVVVGLVLWLVGGPLVLTGVRPLAAAAKGLDGSDPSRRLPIAGVPLELLPVVEAFNGALTRLENLLERRRRFMADAAHELRTPVAVLGAEVDALPESPSKFRLQRGVYRMSQLIGQMLDAERLHGPGLRREAVDLAAIAREAATEVAPLAFAAGYEFEFEAQADPVMVSVDGPAVKRAVTNLLANAVSHAGGAGTIRLRVTGDRVIEVSDDGPGVPVADRDRVFEPFHRERWDRDGCGLGLHLVREIMEAHGGRAELAASQGRGARFRLLFPQYRPAEAGERSTSG